MPGYSVTFRDGTTRSIAKSKREYSHGWKASYRRPDGSEGVFFGFSSSYAGAERNGKYEVLRYGDYTLLTIEIEPVKRSPSE